MGSWGRALYGASECRQWDRDCSTSAPAQIRAVESGGRNSLRLTDPRGKHVLLSFGQTNCPGICPISLNNFKPLKPRWASRLTGVESALVSVDGEREMPAVMKNYLCSFDPCFIGLTAAVRGGEDGCAVWGALRAQDDATNETEYVGGETTDMYLLDEEAA